MNQVDSALLRFRDNQRNVFPDWEEANFTEVLKTVSPRGFQIQSSEILPEGRFKVVDQGKAHIAGFCDNPDKLMQDVPVIVYGDHTTIVKYVDFEFVVGADGTQILVSKDARNDLRFLYYSVVKNNVSQEGYKRHFSILKGVSLHIPSLPEQRKIADFLTAVDGRIGQLSQKKALLEDYKKGVMQQLFTQALRFKDDHGNDFPEWEEKKLGAISKCFSGGTPSSGKRDYYGGTIPFIRSAEIAAESTALFLTEKGLKESAAKMVEAGDLLVALYGANSGEVGISRVTGAINQAILCVRTKQSVRFLFFWLEFSKQSIVKTYLQGGQGNLSGKIVQSLNIEMPTLPEQTKIANFLTALDHKIESVAQQITHTQTFKKGLLQQMFV